MTRMIDIKEYKEFMGIVSFPEFEEEYYVVNGSEEYCYVGQAVYNYQTREHKLRLPSNTQVPKYLLFHELTHILDAEIHANGEKIHDFCLSGYMEYHASQVELMAMVGAKSVKEVLSFSMNDLIGTEWTVRKYVENKLDTAKALIGCFDTEKRISGLGALFNFFGLKSVCAMFAKDFVEDYRYQEVLDKMSSLLFAELRRSMNGWVEDIDNAIILYSHAYKNVTE